MNMFSEKEQKIIAAMQRDDHLKKLEWQRKRLFVLTVAFGLLTLVLIGFMMWHMLELSHVHFVMMAGLALGLVTTVIELVDYRILTVKLLRQQTQHAVADALYELRQSVNVRKEN